MATKHKIVDGPSRWDMMLMVFDPQPGFSNPPKPSRFLSFRCVIEGSVATMLFCTTTNSLSWVNKRFGRLWGLEGYIADPSRIFRITDYSAETRHGFVEFLSE